MLKFLEYFKRFCVWFFRWPSWFEIGAAVILFLTLLHQIFEPLGNFGIFLLCILLFLILSGLWLIRLIYRLFLLLPPIIQKFGRPYAGTQSKKMIVFRWGFWPAIIGLSILSVWQERAIQRIGFNIWKPVFMDVVESKNFEQYSHSWIGWYHINNVTFDEETNIYQFESEDVFFDTGGFLYSPTRNPASASPYNYGEYKIWSLGGGWYVWINSW